MTRRLTPPQSAREVASLFADFDGRLKALERAASLAQASIEDGTLYAYDGTQTATMAIGAQYDGTNTAAVLSGPIPPQPSAPTVTATPGGLSVGWDGFYEDIDAVAPMDYLRVDVTVGVYDGYDAIGTPPVSAIPSARGGTVFVPLEPGTYYVNLIVRTEAGNASSPSLTVAGDVTESATVVSAPTFSPVPVAAGGIDSIRVSWPPIEASVEVHISQDAAFIPTPGAKATFATASDGVAVTIIRLPSGAPLNYSTAYYVRLIAYNSGGSAPPSVTTAVSLSPGSLEMNDGGTTKTTRLRVTSNVDVDPTDPANEPPLILGPATAGHLRMDGNEIYSMQDASTTGRLGLQGKFFGGWDYGITTITTNTAGQDQIPHTLGAAPTIVLLSQTVVGGGYMVRLAARGTASVTVRLLNTDGTAVGATIQADIHWLFIRQ